MLHGFDARWEGSHHDGLEARRGACVLMVLIDAATSLPCAPGPPAKGRAERINSPLQDRLVKALCLAELDTLEVAHRGLQQTFLTPLNAPFTAAPALAANAPMPMSAAVSSASLCVQRPPMAGQDDGVSWQRPVPQLKPAVPLAPRVAEHQPPFAIASCGTAGTGWGWLRSDLGCASPSAAPAPACAVTPRWIIRAICSRAQPASREYVIIVLAKMCYPCVRTPVTYVSGLYTPATHRLVYKGQTRGRGFMIGSFAGTYGRACGATAGGPRCFPH